MLDELAAKSPGENSDLDENRNDDQPPFDLVDDPLEDFLPEIPTQIINPPNQVPDHQVDDADDQPQASTKDGSFSEIQQEENQASQSPTPDDPEDGLLKQAEDKPSPPETPQVREHTTRKPYHVLKTSLPKPEPLPRVDQKPRCIFVTLDSCGDKQQDVRRLRRIYGILVSRPGRDKFAFRVRENGYWCEINFPNVTTGLTDTLIHKLRGLMGDNNIDISQTP